MFHSCKFEFKKPVILKKGAGIQQTYSAIASTASLDRHREILVPRGVITEAFMENPVMLNIHNHRDFPVGKVTDIKVSKEAVQFDFQFADTDEGQKLEKLYNNGFMNAFSVGFIPKNYIDIYDQEGLVAIEVELPDGGKETIDLTKYSEKPYGIISKWELLEISPVPIPANPDALLLRAKDEIVRKFVDAGNSKAAASLLERQLSEKVSDLQKELDAFIKEQDSKLSFAVPHKEYSVVEEAWDSEDARTALVLWSCLDKEHAGEKEFVDWGQFVKGFAWVDFKQADHFTSYQLAHHTVKENELVTVWLGVTEAMMKLLADKSIADAKLVYDHLAAHYAEFSKVAPEFERDYSVEELELIGQGKDLQVTLQVTYTENESSDESEDPSASLNESVVSTEAVKELIKTGFDNLKAQIVELEDTIRLRMNILGKMFDELHKDVVALKEQPEVEEPEIEDTDEAKSLKEELMSLSSMFEDINSVK